MTRIEIWTKRDLLTHTDAKLVWTGEVQSIPRVGEWITIYDGFGSEQVEMVSHELYSGVVIIKLDTADYGDNYTAIVTARNKSR